MEVLFDFILKQKTIYKYKTKCELVWLEPKNDIFKILLKDINFKRIILLRLSETTKRFSCSICRKNFSTGVAIVSDRQFQKMNLPKWVWFCLDCLKRDELKILVKKLYQMEDMYFEIFEKSLNFLSKEGVKNES